VWGGHTLKSIPSSAQHVTLCTLEFDDEEKSKHAGLAQENGFGPSTFAGFTKADKRRSKRVHLPKKSVINMI
jgi:hypothetical protein